MEKKLRVMKRFFMLQLHAHTNVVVKKHLFCYHFVLGFPLGVTAEILRFVL